MHTHRTLTSMLVRKLYPNLEEFTKQKKGCSADYIVNGEYCLEVKLDNKASITGNIFVEYANENKGLVYSSGIALSAKWDYSVLYLLTEGTSVKAYELPARKLLELAEEHGTAVKTRPGANGNREGFHGLGYKMKKEMIEPYLKGVIQL